MKQNKSSRRRKKKNRSLESEEINNIEKIFGDPKDKVRNPDTNIKQNIEIKTEVKSLQSSDKTDKKLKY